jgi:endonuclease/exonuclease/phosphatase family metal-dependent hydrolase
VTTAPSLPAAILLLLPFTACGDDLGVEPLPVALTAISHNIADRTAGPAGQELADLHATARPDLIALQECGDCDSFLEHLPPAYRLAAPSRAGVAIAYDARRWQVDQTDFLRLGDNDDGWGERVAHRARLYERSTGAPLDVYSTHFCVPIRRDDDACDEMRQLDYLAAILQHMDHRGSPGVPVVLAGDLNLFVGFADSDAIRAVLAAGLLDAFAGASAVDAGPTLLGNGWAPPGRIDYLFASAPPSPSPAPACSATAARITSPCTPSSPSARSTDIERRSPARSARRGAAGRPSRCR